MTDRKDTTGLYIFFRMILLFSVLAPVMGRAQDNKNNSGQYLQQIKTEMNVHRNYQKALELTQSAVRAYPRNVDFQYLLGKLYLLNKDTVKGERKIAEIITKVPGYKDAYMTAVDIQLAKGHNKEAIAYLDKGLSQYPGDYPMRLRKLNIYSSARDFNNADKVADALLRIFGKDSSVLQTYINYHNDAGNYFLKKGDLNAASRQFSLAMAIKENDQDALQGNLSALLKMGNDQNSISFINRMLFLQPNSYELLMKKLGLLQEMRRYPEAIETWQQMQKKFPADSKLAQLGQDLQLEAAAYYKKMDPYNEYVSVLDKSPGNREALNNVINIAMSRNMQEEAMVWINKALGYSPDDRDLLTKKMGLLEAAGKYGAAMDIAAKLMRLDPSQGNRQTFIDLQLKRARDFAGQQLYDSSLMAYQSILQVAPGEQQALNGLVNILIQQKDYTTALARINDAIADDPANLALKIKKAAVLQESGDYQAAAAAFQELYDHNPDNQTVRNGLMEALLAGTRPVMAAMDYDQAGSLFEQVLQIDPKNKEALNALVNICLTRGTGTGGTDSAANAAALVWVEKALMYYPADMDFLMKKAEALMRTHQYDQALAIYTSLHGRYPYNTTVRSNYVDELRTAATNLGRIGAADRDTTGALRDWKQLLVLNPKDSLAFLAIINSYQQRGSYQAAVSLADTALAFYPDNAVFVMKKAAALESMQHYEEAADAAAVLNRLYPDNHRYSDYVSYLRGKTYRHQIGFSFLSSHFDSAQTANIATIQYSHLGKKMTLTGKLNFAGRSVGTGLQLELESYIYHGTKWYSYGNLAVANKVVFPKWRAGYSLFHSFAGTWEAELGGRILDFDSLQSVSGVASLAHYFGDFWANLRGYASFLSGHQYTALTLTTRQYLNNKTDFFYAAMGYGNSPDDLSRLYEFGQNLKFTTYSIGAGYQKMFNYRNIVSVNGTWYNQKIAPGRFRNQYDIYLTFFRRF